MRTRLLLLAVVAALVVVAVVRLSDDDEPALGPDEARIERVVDGDTIRVRADGGDETVRLIGIDTPETVHPTKPVECFGKEASEHTKELLPAGTAVRLVRDVELRDRFGRLLAYVYRVEDDLFVNLALARDGYAGVATFPPNVAHTDEFVAAAAEARREGRGLWGACPDERAIRSPP